MPAHDLLSHVVGANRCVEVPNEQSDIICSFLVQRTIHYMLGFMFFLLYSKLDSDDSGSHSLSADDSYLRFPKQHLSHIIGVRDHLIVMSRVENHLS